MVDKFVIKGGKPLRGQIEVRGCKNAATPILAATILTKEPCVIDNLPLVKDVLLIVQILEEMGARVKWLGERKVKIQTDKIDPEKLNYNLCCKMRSSVLLLGPMLARFGRVTIAKPGGCIIGARPIDVHLEAFRKLGIETKEDSGLFHLRAKKNMQGGEIVLKEFSVTGTENVLMASALFGKKVVIKMAASEPHVQDLACFLKKMGVKIQGEGTNTIEVRGRKKLGSAKHFIIYDAVEAGTFALMVAATKGNVLIKNFPVPHLDLFLERIKEFGIKFRVVNKNTVKIEPWENLKIERIQTLPYPGIATDLQSVFGVLATQAKGPTLIHDPLYEGRLKYLEELNRMGAEIIVADPHRAIITGVTKLSGRELGTLDLRGGAALIMAGLIAKGETVINNIQQIDRGYERIEERLQKLGADIKRVNT